MQADSRVIDRPLWHVYVHEGTAFVPDVGRTEAGFFLDVEPVRVAKLDDLPALAAAIEQALAAGNPRVPTPTRVAFPKPVILRPAGVKDWNAFVDRGACFTITRAEGTVDIAETGRNDAGEWMDAPSLTEKLPAGSSALAIATRIAERARRRADLT